MGNHKLHLHSMMVHAVAALAPLAAVAFILLKLDISFYRFNQDTWAFLVVFAVIFAFLVSLLSTLSGIFERGHIYANWHSTHKIKLVLSLLLIALFIIELVILATIGLEGAVFSLLGILLILGNNIVAFLLSVYGLKISLGRQSLARLSYEADLFKKEPVDILVTAGQNKMEEPKYYDLLTER